MEVTEQLILLQAPNANAAANGRKLSKGGKFSERMCSADQTLYWGKCAGSGRTPYQVSVDFTKPGEPVSRCSCPSRQFPCKHALGLMFEINAGKEFLVGEIPQDIAEKRAKQAAREAKKEAAAEHPPKPKKTNAAAQKKKLNRQLEGLDMAQKMVDDLLTAGIGTLAGSSAQTYDKLAKDLGNYYLTGPQMSFSRLALEVLLIQKASEQEQEAHYAEALRILIALRSTIKKARAFLQEKLSAEQYTAEDTVLFEALGGVWRLEDLHAIGAYKQNARLVQLSFDVSFDAAKKEYVERGWWLDLDSGEIDQTLNLRPLKAMKYIKGEDSHFELLEVPTLYRYPGECNRRIRWDGSTPRSIQPQEQAALPSLAQPNLAAAVKLVKGQIKNTLLPKYVAVLLPVGKIGRVKDQLVLEDPVQGRIALRDRPEDGCDHATIARLRTLPQASGHEGELRALFGLMFYDERDHSLCLSPYSLVTQTEIIRLLY